MTIPAYPLQWPAGWKRASVRRAAAFSTKRESDRGGRYTEVSIAEGVRRVRKELEAMRISDNDVVISTNVPLRMDGFPRGDGGAVADSGVAVYWMDRKGNTRCMAIDQYYRVADNLAAVAATLSAMRAIERHGGAEILDRAFTGFVALAGPTPWWEVLDVPNSATRADIDAAYLRKRSAAHPDRGGSPDAFQAVTHAYQQAINRT